MPPEGHKTITVSEDLFDKMNGIIEGSGGLLTNSPELLRQALDLYGNIALKERFVDPVKIGNRYVGPGYPVFIIAEIGINHNGDMNICKKLIDMSVEAGCDAVKFQKRTVEDVYTAEELAKPRDSPFGKTNGDLKRALEFGLKEYREIDEYCKEKGIMWFASPWDLKSVDFLKQFDVPCYKIASASLTDRALLEKVRATGKPVILSTGMSTLDQVYSAVHVLGDKNIVLMHCTSTYPTAPEEENLKMINTLKKYFNNPIGYSGHENGIEPTMAAITLGACAIERHITLDRSMWGSDQAASLEKEGLTRICRFARHLPVYMGDGVKRVFDSEKPIISKLRKAYTL